MLKCDIYKEIWIFIIIHLNEISLIEDTCITNTQIKRLIARIPDAHAPLSTPFNHFLDKSSQYPLTNSIALFFLVLNVT